MQTLYDLYLQNPFWIWLAVGAVFVALDIATGAGKLIWPGVAAAALAFVNLAAVRLGLPVELAVFGVVSVIGLIVTSGFHRRRPHASPDNTLQIEKKTTLPTPEALEAASQDRTGRLIGRIGRTTGEFVNGVGRVWIDGAEWGAEIDAGDDALPPDAPVRVMGVTGGVRLQVRGLMAG
jgi:membrane protein implicated in regulation of membrane protease activity